MTNRQKAFVALLTNAALWGLALPLVKLGFEEITPLEFLFYRYLFASLVSIPLLILFWKKVGIRWRELPELILIGLTSTVFAHLVLYAGLERSTAIEASVLTALIPVLISIGGAVFLKEKITKQEKIGTGIALLGSLVIIAEPVFLNGGKFSFSSSIGNLLILSYNLLWMVAVLWMKKVANKYHPFTIAWVSFTTALVSYGVMILVSQPGFNPMAVFQTQWGLWSTLYMGTLGSVAALSLYQYGQKYVEASEATLFTYLTVLFNLPLAMIWLHEKPTSGFILGMGVIVAGLVVAETRKQHKKRSGKKLRKR